MTVTDSGVRLTRFPPQVLAWWRSLSLFGTVIAGAGVWLGCTGVFFSWRLRDDVVLGIILLLALTCLAENLWILPARWRTSGWAIGPDHLEWHRGVLLKRVRIYPRGAVLFAEHRSNPVLRRLQLLSVHLHDVTGPHEFGHVTDDDFERIAAFVAQERLPSSSEQETS